MLSYAARPGPRYNQLSPDVKKEAFSPEEDSVIIKVCATLC